MTLAARAPSDYLRAMAKVMLSSVYDALREAGASDAKARQAAEDVASYDSTIAGLRTEIRVAQAVGGVIIVLMAAGLWQLVGLNGVVARLDERTTNLERRVDEGFRLLDARLAGIEQRLPSAAPR